MPAKFRGAGATIDKLEELVRKHGCLLIEHDPNGVRIVLADKHVAGDGTTWFKEEAVGSGLPDAVRKASEIAMEVAS